MQAVREPPPRRQASGELVDDDDLAILDHVFAVTLVDGVGLEGVLGKVDELEVLRRVHVLDSEHFFQLRHALGRQGDRAQLLVDGVVDALAQGRYEAGEPLIVLGRLLRRAADDEGRPRLVDQDVVYLVDNRVMTLSLHTLGSVRRHGVAQIVEAELAVRPVGDIGLIRLLPRDGSEVLEPLLGAFDCRVIEVGGLVLEGRDRYAEGVVDGAHPLRVALGEVVVDGHDMDAAAGESVQVRRQRGDERLALACLHLGDLALVEHDAAHDLHVESGAIQSCVWRPRGRRRTPPTGCRQGPPPSANSALNSSVFDRKPSSESFSSSDSHDATASTSGRRRLTALSPPPVRRFVTVLSMRRSFHKPCQCAGSSLVYYNEWMRERRTGQGRMPKRLLLRRRLSPQGVRPPARARKYSTKP